MKNSKQKVYKNENLTYGSEKFSHKMFLWYPIAAIQKLKINWIKDKLDKR